MVVTVVLAAMAEQALSVAQVARAAAERAAAAQAQRDDLGI
jgi:hypothetical protein